MNKLHLLPKLNEEDLNLLLTIINSARWLYNKVDDPTSDLARIKLTNLYDNIQLNTIEIDSDWNYYTKV